MQLTYTFLEGLVVLVSLVTGAAIWTWQVLAHSRATNVIICHTFVFVYREMKDSTDFISDSAINHRNLSWPLLFSFSYHRKYSVKLSRSSTPSQLPLTNSHDVIYKFLERNVFIPVMCWKYLFPICLLGEIRRKLIYSILIFVTCQRCYCRIEYPNVSFFSIPIPTPIPFPILSPQTWQHADLKWFSKAMFDIHAAVQ